MPNATRSPGAKDATERLDPVEVAQKVADELHETELSRQITEAALDARALAWLALDLAHRFNRLRDAIEAFAWRDLARLAEAGLSDDFLLTVEERAGLGVVDDVLYGIRDLTRKTLEGSSYGAEQVRHHAGDHFREVGKPSILHAASGASAGSCAGRSSTTV
jgi:hypothetical protein